MHNHLPSDHNGNPDLHVDEGIAQPDHATTEALTLAEFWGHDCAFDQVVVSIAPPATPLAMLEQLGPSPFPRGGFPLIGFLATTYEKVSRYAIDEN